MEPYTEGNQVVSSKVCMSEGLVNDYVSAVFPPWPSNR